jgi:hypothetical protein
MVGDVMERDPRLASEADAWSPSVDPNAAVSHHVRPLETPQGLAGAPEHDWAAAQRLVMPLLRPPGMIGTPLGFVDEAWRSAEATRAHHEIVVDPGPLDLAVVYAIPAEGFAVIVNGDHLVSWRVDAAALRGAALANLAAWSEAAPWTDEVSGGRRVISSATGDGWDAARILLPDVRAHLAEELGAGDRVLVGLPERDLLVATSLRAEDPDFATLFAAFVSEQAEGTDESIDPRIFELVGGELVALEMDGAGERPATEP